MCGFGSFFTGFEFCATLFLRHNISAGKFMGKKLILLFFLILLISPCWAGNLPEAAKDSKPGLLQVIDRIWLKPVIVRMGTSRMPVLVNKLTDKVEYVWSYVYKRYVRPKYTMVNAQALYEQFHN